MTIHQPRRAPTWRVTILPIELTRSGRLRLLMARGNEASVRLLFSKEHPATDLVSWCVDDMLAELGLVRLGVAATLITTGELRARQITLEGQGPVMIVMVAERDDATVADDHAETEADVDDGTWTPLRTARRWARLGELREPIVAVAVPELAGLALRRLRRQTRPGIPLHWWLLAGLRRHWSVIAYVILLAVAALCVPVLR
jgi:hypothetical protein